MAKRTEDTNAPPRLTAGPALPRMLTLDQVKEVLNVNTPLVYALVRSGELRAAQFGGRNVWRVREDDLLAYIDAAYEKTAHRIAAGQIPEETTSED
ncbi:helix-turn-helix domain-containing protein [Arthrobacter sp. NPDC056886]|uniref:helix-turn-helix domain-containing protein n=1 Tax=Arthrobacter sp. NPDC056886 TaxID=3345960 RepID=UPI00366CA604